MLHPLEHSNPQTSNVGRKIRDFRSCLLDAELSDLVYKDNTFTWWNKSKTRPVAKKLDRVLVNESWIIQHPSAMAIFGEPDISDHASCSVLLDPLAQKGRKPFKFFNFLFQNRDFINLIREKWYSLNVFGSAMYRVSKNQ